MSYIDYTVYTHNRFVFTSYTFTLSVKYDWLIESDQKVIGSYTLYTYVKCRSVVSENKLNNNIN